MALKQEKAATKYRGRSIRNALCLILGVLARPGARFITLQSLLGGVYYVIIYSNLDARRAGSKAMAATAHGSRAYF